MSRNSLLVVPHDIVGECGSVGALASVVEGGSIARVAVAADVALATAEVHAGILLSGAPISTLTLRNLRGRDGAARNGSVEGAILDLGGANGEGRGGGDNGRVAHG